MHVPSIRDVDRARRRSLRARLIVASTTLLTAAALPAVAAHAADLQATPSTFSSVFSGAKSGDVIHLAAGDYGTFRGGSKSGPVTITGTGATLSASLGASQNLILDGLTIRDMSTNGARNLVVQNSTFTGATVIQTPTSAPNANIVIDHNTFSNIDVCSSCYEGRLAVRGYQNTQPVGVTISNNLFGPGGDSDGIQIVGDAYGVQIGPGNEFRGLAQVSTAHTDAIQLYGSSHTLITGNWMHDNATGIMAPDGSDHEIITNNVISTTGYPWPIVMGNAVGNTVTHNTLPGSGGAVEVDKSNDGTASSGNVVTDNVLASVVSASGGKPQGTTVDYNLISGGTQGSHDVKGKPTYVGGSAPTTWAGFALTSSSAGAGQASDGLAMGIVPGTPLGGGPSSPGTPGAPGAPGTNDGGGGTVAGTTTPGTGGSGGTGGTSGSGGSGGTDGDASGDASATASSTRSAAGGGGPLAITRSALSQTRFSTKLRFAVTVRSRVGAVDRVAFMLDGRWIATAKRRPYALTYKVPRNLRYRAHVLRIKAIAKSGTSGSISVKVTRVRPFKG
ncbi:MAG TPA: right-handed parallel beta-helix repeat-containing protein [Baekduia sp.]|uniref:right-handed parallel beta-helix repeat-containing protein n=1 Tax=Baekduia sp. TaxID=2600305 RepID=UPI002D798006|nr:right-handed parallel beta-helix repeat-containing protein [Baekduia sp.]HET6508251.1 right-handed parallel beta-helix repeat-containing protein [Baekduia sp.]